jgi:glycerol-1-phosphate dehydrogenase [NAD(P)+]
MKIDPKTMVLQDYLGKTFTCDCGKEHSTVIERVEIGKDALATLPSHLRDFGYTNPYVVCDEITYSIAGEKLIQILTDAGISVTHCILPKGFVPDEKALGTLLIHMDPKCDVVIAVGTGSLNDLVRYLSFKFDLEFITCATAAPMDGFASSVAALVVNNFKITYETHSPRLIVGDTEILKNAPISLITAGLGDILGKYTCLCDWKLSQVVNGEYICPHILEMVYSCIDQVYQNADRISQRDPEVVGQVMSALVLTGVAMSFVGNSRPAAGCEHHLSHYWEMRFMQLGLPPVLHGTKVGIGTVMMLKAAELLRTAKVDFDAARKRAIAYSQEAWEADIHRVYGPAAEGTIETERQAGKNTPAHVLARIDATEKNWEQICALLSELPSADDMKALLSKLGAPYFPAQVGIDDEMLRNAILFAKETRARYTMLQMIWDLGLSEAFADQIVAYVHQ